MTYVKFDPMKGFETLANTFSKVAGEVEKEMMQRDNSCKPGVDISEFEGVYYVQVELPGMSKEEISISVNNENMLVVKGEKKKPETEGRRIIRSERRFGSFRRSFVLPDDADKDKISAKYERGVLELSIPKVAPAAPEEFEIKIS